MKRGALTLAAVVACCLGPAAGAQEHGGHSGPRVSVQFASYAPKALDIVAGETVTWTNDTVRQHTVTADDGAFDSGRMFGGDTYRRRFDRTGRIDYHCSLHAGIVGSVAVYSILLDAPPGAASAGRPFPLRGRAALAPGTPVTIQADSGAGFEAVAAAEVAPDGTFATTFTPRGTSRLRAIAGGAEPSPDVQLLVLDRRVGVKVVRARGRITVDATVAPPSHRGRVTLQFFLRDRFGWWPVRSRQLDHHSSARLSLRYPRRVRARVVLTLDDGATVLATSRTFRVGGR